MRSASSVVRALASFCIRAVRSPILLSQVFVSANGAAGVLVAASFMSTQAFTGFTLIALVATLALGLNRSLVLQPALIHQRHDSAAMVPLTYMAPSAIFATAAMVVSGYLFAQPSARLFLLLAGTSTLPILADWLRFRRLAENRRWPVAVSDGLRLFALPGVLLIPDVLQSPVAFQVYLQGAAGVQLILLVHGHARLRSWTPFKSYRRAASLQMADFVVGQANSTLPLLVLGGIGAAPFLAAVRLAQTLFGPLNTISSGITMTFLADGATDGKMRSDGKLVAAGRRVSLTLLGVSLLYSFCAVAALGLLGVSFESVSEADLYAACLLVGCVAVVSGWSGIHSVILRLLGQQVLATTARIVMVTVVMLSFLVGYQSGGTVTSIFAGSISSAIMYPLVFIIPAELYYRQLFRRGPGGAKV